MIFINRSKFPERITVEMTNRCNLECSFCPRHLINMKLGEMEAGLFQKIVDEAEKHLPVSLVFFFRGESLLHPKLADCIRYAKQKGLGPLQLASNGFNLTEEIAEKLLDSGLDFISFSLDTIDPEVYKMTRPQGDLTRSMENVLQFAKKIELRKKKGLHVPEIQVSSIDVEDYRPTQENFVQFWRQYADRVRIYVEHSADGNLGSIKLDVYQGERQPCKKVSTDMVIYWDGKVALCNHDWDNQLEMGDVNKQSIKAIWNSSKYESVCLMHEKNSFKPGIVCKNCDHWKMYYLPEGYLGRVYDKITEA